MRILHLVSRSHRRGAELVALELAEELDARGHVNRVLALVPAENGAVDPSLPPLVDQVELRPTVRARCTWRFHRLIAEEHYDVVLAHGGWPAQVAAFGTGRAGPVLVWQRILGFPASLWRGPRRGLWRTVAGRVDAAVGLTASDAAEMRKLGFTGPIWVIPNFRRPERFLAIDRPTASAALRREIGIDGDVGLIGFVGHLVDQKRPERAVDLIVELRRRGRPAHLVVAGDGPRREQMEARARDRGVAGSVSMLGHRNDVELVFGGVDVAILTSDAEGMPGVAIEAQMAGCPLVSFPVGGVAEVVEDGVTGMVLARPDTGLMADDVDRLLGDATLRARMGAAARLRAGRFTARQSAASYEAHLESYLERPVADPHAHGRVGRRRPAEPLEARLPNLFVLGAPKAGTTFVHQALRLAPDVYMSEVKEPGFFTSREYRLGLDHYARAYFRGAEGHPLRGESTPWYLYSEDARRRIAELPMPGAPKLVVFVRRPADRALSMHRDQVRIHRESRSFELAVEEELRGLDRGDLAEDVRNRYVWCGFYSRHIRAWQDAFGPDSVQMVVFEDLARDGATVWSELTSFLGQDLGPPTFSQVSERDKNLAGDLRWPRLDRLVRSFEGRELPPVELAKRALPPGAHRRLLQRLGRLNREGSGDAQAERVTVDSAVLTHLDGVFADEREQVEQLLGRPIVDWSDARPRALS